MMNYHTFYNSKHTFSNTCSFSNYPFTFNTKFWNFSFTSLLTWLFKLPLDIITIMLGFKWVSLNALDWFTVFGYPYNTYPCIWQSTWDNLFWINPFIIESSISCFCLIFYKANLPTSELLPTCSTKSYLADTYANPYLLVNFLAT